MEKEQAIGQNHGAWAEHSRSLLERRSEGAFHPQKGTLYSDPQPTSQIASPEIASFHNFLGG